jgi:NTP pyrophosphatase (non-canonical NTP hydrolase)
VNITEYQVWTRKTAKYPKELTQFEPSLAYLILGLAGEAGEVANKYKKIIRDKSGIMDHEDEVSLIDELGDVLWYIARIVDELGYGLTDLAGVNYHKLESRLQRGKIGGSGDNR